MFSGVYNENAAKTVGGDGQRVSAVFPVHIDALDEFEIEFIHASRRLSGVAWALGAHVKGSDAPELGLENADQLTTGSSIAAAPSFEQGGDGPFGSTA